MDNWEAQTLMYGICAIFGAVYAFGAARELLSPEQSAQLVEAVGLGGFYALTIGRLLVCVWVAVSFGRMSWKAFANRDQ